MAFAPSLTFVADNDGTHALHALSHAHTHTHTHTHTHMGTREVWADRIVDRLIHHRHRWPVAAYNSLWQQLLLRLVDDLLHVHRLHNGLHHALRHLWGVKMRLL